MLFYLGTHRPSWLERLDVPMFVSRRTMPKHKAYRPLGRWALDSGGFTELGTYGAWTISEREYVGQVERFRAFGGMDWAAPMDWMTEPRITAMTGLSVLDHQRLTVENYLRLAAMLPSTFIPVLQGQTVADYQRHVRMYGDEGVDLAALPLVGLGSVCRRENTGEIEDIVLSLRPIPLHGFGCKAGALRRVGHLLVSADSMAWSYAGRRHGGCAGRCANHLHYALSWRERVLRPRPLQLHLTTNEGAETE